MMATLTCADVLPTVGQEWQLADSEGNRVSLFLYRAVESTKHQVSSLSPRVPFSMLFYAAPAPMIPQGLYILEHPDVGRLDGVLVVPLHPSQGPGLPDVSCYQVGFG